MKNIFMKERHIHFIEVDNNDIGGAIFSDLSRRYETKHCTFNRHSSDRVTITLLTTRTEKEIVGHLKQMLGRHYLVTKQDNGIMSVCRRGAE